MEANEAGAVPDPPGVPRPVPSGTVPLGAPTAPPPPMVGERNGTGPGAGLQAVRRPAPGRGPSGGGRLQAGLSRWLSRWGGRAKRELQARRARWVTEARLPLTRPLVIVVASPKGGVGKTTISSGGGEELAALRAERIAILDAEPLGGTLGLRVNAQPGPGVPALLGELDAVEADGSYTAWSRFATVEHSTRVTVFGRTSPLEGAELTIDSYKRVIAGLIRQWPIVIVDTGRPEGRDVLQASAVNSADVLVVVCGPGKPTVDAVAGWLHEVKVPPERRVGVLSAPNSGGDPAEAHALLASHCSAVIHVPRDPALDADAPVPMLGGAKPATRDAFLALAAAVMRASQSLRPEENP